MIRVFKVFMLIKGRFLGRMRIDCVFCFVVKCVVVLSVVFRVFLGLDCFEVGLLRYRVLVVFVSCCVVGFFVIMSVCLIFW